MRIELVDEVNSTNESVKGYLPEGENVIVCARRQTAGKGTKGRSFLSEEGGVYLSALLFPRDLRAEDAFLIMTHAAVSVCRAAEAFGVYPEIKWPNDVYVRGRKLCGILIENSISRGRVAHSVVGIGLNAENDVSSLGGIAVSLSEAAGRRIAAERAREELIRAFCTHDDFSDYLARVKFLGKTVRVTEGAREFEAVARRILPDGRLEIAEKGTVRALFGAEISLKL